MITSFHTYFFFLMRKKLFRLQLVKPASITISEQIRKTEKYEKRFHFSPIELVSLVSFLFVSLLMNDTNDSE